MTNAHKNKSLFLGAGIKLPVRMCVDWIILAFLIFPASAFAQRLELSNPLGVKRTPEVIELPLKDVLLHLHLRAEQAGSIVAKDGRSGQRITTQIYAQDPGAAPDQLLLLVDLGAHERRTVRFDVDASPPKPEALVFGREAPERKDDFAWENELVTYRVYGPALQATGEIASGIDVWSKRVPDFVIDSFYKRDAEGARTHNPTMSYHKDNGQGLDSYYVGPTRGCGGTAAYVDGKLYSSKNYTDLHVIADGPIRFAFEVTYAPWDAGGTSVTETKRIILDAGTHLNRIESRYSFAGSGTMPLVAGIAVHEGAKAEIPVSGSVVSVWDTPQDPTAGRIATGMIAVPEQHGKTIDAAGHALLEFDRHSGEPFKYYAGSGWSKSDMPTAADWNAYLKSRLEMLENPIRTRWILK